jgi:DnaJ-class molecular chaperone
MSPYPAMDPDHPRYSDDALDDDERGPEPCPHCKGKGYIRPDGYTEVECVDCDGTGDAR